MDAGHFSYELPADTPYRKYSTSPLSTPPFASPPSISVPRHFSPTSSTETEPRMRGSQQGEERNRIHTQASLDATPDNGKAQDMSPRRTRAAPREQHAGVQDREAGRRASFGRRRGCEGRHIRIRPRTRRSGAGGRRSPVPSASGLAKFAVLSIFLAFYAQKCLNKGFPGLFFPRRSSLHDIRKKGNDALPLQKPSTPEGRFSWRAGSVRRLAGEEHSRAVLHARSKRGAAEEALCSALEASALAVRAAAAQAVAEESDEEALPGRSTLRSRTAGAALLFTCPWFPFSSAVPSSQSPYTALFPRPPGCLRVPRVSCCSIRAQAVRGARSGY